MGRMRHKKPWVSNVGSHVLCVVLLATITPASTTTTTTTKDPSITLNTTTVSSQSLPSVDTSFSNVTLRKCICGVDEVLIENHCVEMMTAVLCSGPEGRFGRNTSDFSTVHIGEPECKEDFTLGTLPLNGHLLLMANGTILWETGNILLEDYCIEHLYYSDTLIVIGKACLPPPNVPQCCPSGHVIAHDGSCHPDPDQAIFEPPVFVHETLSVAGQGFERDTVEKTCSDDDDDLTRVTYVTLNTNTSASMLMYMNPQAVLQFGMGVLFNNQKDYCVGMKRDHENKLTYTAKVCALDRKLEHQSLCSGVPCVRKCCSNGTSIQGIVCIQAMTEEEKWQPVFHKDKNPSAITPFIGDWRLVNGLPLCSDPFLIDQHSTEDKFHLLANGSLYVSRYSTSLPSSDYCMDLKLRDDFSVYGGVALICLPKPPKECLWRHTLITVLFGVSCVFLAATVLIYLGVPDLRERTNGRCLVSMAVAMIASYISIIVASEVPDLNAAECRTVAFLGHVGSLAMFFWLNVMCFDMWSTLRSSKQQYHSLKRFGLYSLYAWGCPLLVGLVGIVMDLVQPEGAIIPNFTQETCWFSNNAEFWLYLSGFVVALVAVNLFFFIHVAVSLAKKMKRRRKVFEGRTDMTTNVKKQAWLYVKLFIVMGISWISDVISSIHQRKGCKIWVLADIINASQGVFIFLVAICNKENLKKIRSAWQPRVDSMRKSVSNLRGASPSTPSHQKNLSVDMSDASRKTSVTSLPRKLSAVSNFFLPTGNKHHSGSSDVTQGRRGSESPAPRKYSAVSTQEHIALNTLDE